MLKDEPKKDWRRIALVSLGLLVYLAAATYALYLPDKTLFNIIMIVVFAAFIPLTLWRLREKSGEERVLSLLAVPMFVAFIISKINETFVHIPVANEVTGFLLVTPLIADIPALLIYGHRRDQRKRREFEYSLQQLAQTEEYDHELAPPTATPINTEQPKQDKLKEQPPRG